MALANWLLRIAAELAEDSAYMVAHVIRLFVYLGLEFGLSWFQSLPQLRAIEPITQPILQCAIPFTVLLFCGHLVFILALKVWEDAERRLDEGQHGWPTAVGIIAVVLVVSIVYVIKFGGPLPKPVSAKSSSLVVSTIAVLDLTKLDERSYYGGALINPGADELEFKFRVPVEEGFAYLLQVDSREAIPIGFQPSGVFTAKLPSASIVPGRHRFDVFRYKLQQKPQISGVKSIPFEIVNDH